MFQHDVMENSKAMELWNIILRQFRNGTSSNMIEHNGPVPGFDIQPNEGFLKCGYPLIIHFIWICKNKPSIWDITIYGKPQMPKSSQKWWGV